MQQCRMGWRGSTRERVREAAVRFGHELRLAGAGMSMREIGRRAEVSQSTVSRVMRGIVAPDLRLMVRLSEAVGHRFRFTLYPADGVTLRDSGQLRLAAFVRETAHATWRVRFEVPVGRGADRRAADVLLESATDAVHVELERSLYDFQAQLRAAQLKRMALAERLGRRVYLVIGVPDTRATRRAVAPHAGIIATALPVSSRRAWAAIRSGEGLGGDALLWIRRSWRAADARDASRRASTL